MVQRSARASNKTFRLCLAAAAVGLLCNTAGAASVAEPDTDTTRVIVKFKKGQKAVLKSLVAGLKGKVKHEIFNDDAMAVEVPRALLKNLENNPNVEFIEEDAKRYPLALTSPSTGTPYTSRPAGPVRHQDGAGRPAERFAGRQPQGLHHRLRHRPQP